MISKPTTRRRIVAAILVGIAFLYTVAVKLLREEASQALAPPWLAGVLPNLVCAAVVPLMLFTSPRIVTVRDYVTMTLFIALGLEVYEATQLMMPRRTFDWADVWATAAGVPVQTRVAQRLSGSQQLCGRVSGTFVPDNGDSHQMTSESVTGTERITGTNRYGYLISAFARSSSTCLFSAAVTRSVSSS